MGESANKDTSRENIVEEAKRYRQQSLWIVAGLTLLLLLVMSITGNSTYVGDILICVVYSLLLNFIFITLWRVRTKTNLSLSPVYAIGMSVGRLLLSLICVVTCCLLIKNNNQRLSFIAVFSAYYVAMLIYDSVFLVRINKLTINNHNK